jgi:hypothetical protein
MGSNISIELTPAEVNIIRQSLRAEHDRMVKQGYTQLARLAIETSSKIADVVIDRNISVMYDENIKPQGVAG